MSSYAGFYTIIQYFPRIERGEGINVGIALFGEVFDAPMVRMVKNNERVRLRFPDHRLDEQRFDSEKAALDRRLRRLRIGTMDELREFIGKEAGHLAMMPPCPVLVRSPLQELDELFEDFVGEPPTRKKRRQDPPNIEPLFNRLLVGSLVRKNVEVELPSLGRLVTPYVYRNGVDNHVKPYGFGSKTESAMASAKHLALIGQVLHQHPGEDAVRRKLVVVASFGDRGVIGDVRMLLKDCNVRLVVQDDLPSFAQEVEREAHPMDAVGALVLTPSSANPATRLLKREEAAQ